MSGDKRSVSTDALEVLGNVITDEMNVGRDAIHLAVEPVVAGQSLFPGQHVGLDEDNLAVSTGKTIGIVDPFLLERVFPGEKFFLVVYPRKITSLRHVWTHPDFQEESVKIINANATVVDDNNRYRNQIDISEQWLRSFAVQNDIDFHLMLAATENNNDGEYITVYGSDARCEIPDVFWDHLEIFTGRKFANIDRATYFSCSC